MNETQAVLSVVGLPGSGKTTFLAALWDALSRPADGPRPLSLARLPAERQYLGRIHTRWLRCERTPRTRKGEGVRHLELELRSADSGETRLLIPDIAGEAFDELWEERTWAKGIYETAEAAQGVALFVHATDIVPPHPLLALEAGTPIPPDEGEEVEPPEPWDPAAAPTQVKLIDLIQAVSGADDQRKILPLAIIFSAWDTIGVDGLKPEQYLESQLPMLAQFLHANEARLPSQSFGVSAQGGDVEDEAEAARLRSIDPPSDRVRVIEQTTVTHDITAPLRSLLESVVAAQS